MALNKIGVVGAGLMGSGIAQVAAQAGFDVLLNDWPWQTWLAWTHY